VVGGSGRSAGGASKAGKLTAAERAVSRFYCGRSGSSRRSCTRSACVSGPGARPVAIYHGSTARRMSSATRASPAKTTELPWWTTCASLDGPGLRRLPKLGRLAVATGWIGLVTPVCQVHMRSPPIAANELATVEHLADGRLIVGFGAGSRCQRRAAHAARGRTAYGSPGPRVWCRSQGSSRLGEGLRPPVARDLGSLQNFGRVLRALPHDDLRQLAIGQRRGRPTRAASCRGFGSALGSRPYAEWDVRFGLG
jgi:hypothetical protein